MVRVIFRDSDIEIKTKKSVRTSNQTTSIRAKILAFHCTLWKTFKTFCTSITILTRKVCCLTHTLTSFCRTKEVWSPRITSTLHFFYDFQYGSYNIDWLYLAWIAGIFIFDPWFFTKMSIFKLEISKNIILGI